MAIGLFQQDEKLTREALEDLLAWLDSDRKQAEEKYRSIRAKLLETFESNVCNNPDILADEVVIRVTKRIPKLVYTEARANLLFEKAARKVSRNYLKYWATTKEAFDRLLRWLDPDQEQASIKYGRIHTALTAIFRRHGIADAESLADRTVERIVRKVPKLERTYVGDPQRYFAGVAKKICQEHTRLSEASRKAQAWYGRSIGPTGPPPDLTQDIDESKEHKCFYECLQSLKPDDHDLLLAYYQEEKGEKIRGRKELAESFKITAGNLRVRRHRIYASLVKCIDKCMKRE
jgi:hypothetical protein